MTEPREVVDGWSDARIDSVAVNALGDYGTMTLFSAKKIMRQIRDDLRATIDAQAQEIASLKAELAKSQEYARCMEIDAVECAAFLEAVAPGYNPSIELQTNVQLQAARIAELEAEHITLWHTINTQAEYIDSLEASGWQPVVYGAAQLETHSVFVENDGRGLIFRANGRPTFVVLTDGYRLCTRKPQEGAQS